MAISPLIIPQIQGQPPIETDQASLGLGSVVPTTALLDSSRLPESLRCPDMPPKNAKQMDATNAAKIDQKSILANPDFDG
jgi:hypothetical protein